MCSVLFCAFLLAPPDEVDSEPAPAVLVDDSSAESEAQTAASASAPLTQTSEVPDLPPRGRSEAARPRGGGFDEGGYIYLTPGPFVLLFDKEAVSPPRFGWGIGAGYMFSRGKLFKATLGAVFEHTVLYHSYDYYAGAHVIRFMPETRIGLGSNKVWGYGMFGVGITGLFQHYLGPGLNYWPRQRDSAPGVNMQFGGGVQGIVYKNLFLGGEIDFDVGLFNDSLEFKDPTLMQLAFEFMIGGYF